MLQYRWLKIRLTLNCRKYRSRVKWLGPESCKFAKSIRAANAHDPPRGLQRIYVRLQERYGSPEMVESAMTLAVDWLQLL
jgi:hypothetical protein